MWISGQPAEYQKILSWNTKLLPLKGYIPILAKFQPQEILLEIFKAGSEIPWFLKKK